MMSYTLLMDRMPTPSETRSGSRSPGAFLSTITAGKGLRGCATTASVTMMPSTGAITGRMVFCEGFIIQML